MKKILLLPDGELKKPKTIIIGEIPHKEENKIGRVFVGQSGKNLHTHMGIPLDSKNRTKKKLLITNVRGMKTPFNKTLDNFLNKKMNVLILGKEAWKKFQEYLWKNRSQVLLWKIFITCHPSPKNLKIKKRLKEFQLIKKVTGLLLLFLLLTTSIYVKAENNTKLSTALSEIKEFESYKLLDLLSNNLRRHYSLNKKYNTALKYKNFKKTAKYKTLKQKFSKEKQEVQKASFYIPRACTLKNYDLKRKGFKCIVNDSTIEEFWRTIDDKIAFGYSIPLKKRHSYTGPYGDKIYKTSIFIHTSEEIGTKIEESSNISVFFIVSNLKTILIKSNLGSLDTSERYIFTNDLRIIIADKTSDKIYIDKIFKKKVNKKKK